EETGDGARSLLRARAHAEPPDQDREEDDLRWRPEIVEQRLIGALDELAGAQRDSDRDTAQAPDQERDPDLVKRGAEMAVELRVGERLGQRADNGNQRG